MQENLERISKHLGDDTIKLNHVLMADVEIPAVDGAPVTVKRVNWPAYHQLVEGDLQELRKVEEASSEEEATKPEEPEEPLTSEMAEVQSVDDYEAKEETPEPQEAEASPPAEQEDAFPEGASIFGG